MVNRESSMSLRQAIHFDDSRRLRRALQDAPRVAWRYHKATRFIDNMLLCIGNRENCWKWMFTWNLLNFPKKLCLPFNLQNLWIWTYFLANSIFYHILPPEPIHNQNTGGPTGWCLPGLPQRGPKFLPKVERSVWQLAVQVGSQSISPLFWALRSWAWSGSFWGAIW